MDGPLVKSRASTRKAICQAYMLSVGTIQLTVITDRREKDRVSGSALIDLTLNDTMTNEKLKDGQRQQVLRPAQQFI